MTEPQKIGAARVDFAAHQIDGPTGKHTMEPKVMAVLDRLARRAPEVITRQALIDDVWAGESMDPPNSSPAADATLLMPPRGQETEAENE